MRIFILFVAMLMAIAACTEEDDCYKCDLVSADGRFGTTTYLKCDVDVDEYMMHMLESGKVGQINCDLMK